MPKTYRLSAAGLAQMRRRFVLLMSVYLALAFGVALALNLWRRPENPLVYVVVAAVVVGGIAFLVVPRSLKQNEAVWASLRIEVGEDYVERQQAGVPDLRLRRAEVVAIEAAGNGLLLHTTDPYLSLRITRDLETADFQTIQQQLGEWQPIKPAAGERTRLTTLATLVALAGSGTLIFANELGLVLVAGLVTTGFSAYLLGQTSRMVGTDPGLVRLTRFSLVPPILLALIKICALTGGYEAAFRVLSALSGTSR